MDSLVIGLCGEWGCGKTSLKNLIVERLRLRKKRRVDLVEFSPWQMSGHDSISGAFFRELGLKLEKDSDAGSPAAKSAQRLRRYSTAAAFGGAVTRWIGTALRIKDNEAGEIVESAGHALGEVGKVGGQAATAADSVDESREQSLAELKASLSEEMRELDSPVLCVIDDIDRLTSDEIREVFQLVKANADFPNLIFLLLFDRGIVGGALDSVSNGKGDQFLEKIVQVLFHVPQPSLKAVHGALFAGLNRQLDRFDLSETWIQQRWGEVWADGLSEYFHNLRSVYRFLASYTFQVEQFRRKRTSEVNLLDLVVLEVLRLFEPRFYKIIARNKNLFTGVEKRVMFFKEEEALKARKEELEELLKCVEQDRRSRVSRLVENLFPLLGGPPEHDCLEREARVGHSAYFDRYFTLSLSDDDVSQVDLDALRESLTKPRELAEVCERLRRKGLLAAAFSRMDAFKEKLETTIFPEAITALCDVGEGFSEKEKIGLLDPNFDSLTYCWRLIYFGLRRISDEDRRFRLLRDGISASNCVRLAVDLVSHEERRDSRDGHRFIVSEMQVGELKPIALERLRSAAGDGRLRTMIGLSSLIYRWSDWAGEEEVRNWVLGQLRGPEDAHWLVRLLLSKMTSSRGRYGTITRYITPSSVKRFANFKTIDDLTRELKLDDLPIDDARALRAFRFAAQWDTEGKPDNFFDHLPEDHPLVEQE